MRVKNPSRKTSLRKSVEYKKVADAEMLCPSCNSPDISIFYILKNVPVHSVLLMPSRQAALNYRRGDITLGLCHCCGFIANFSFEPGLLEYSSRCEETQACSQMFTAFHQRLANYLIDRFDLHNKDIIEIGCGKGEFLTLLCQLGDNRGVGFDPAYVKGRQQIAPTTQITFIEDFFSEKYSDYHADLICCKMTLEHIHQTSAFMRTLRDSIGDRHQTIVFFQVPEVLRILRQIAFWDIYYEHCSYFSRCSLTALCQQAGFDVIETWNDYEGQYLMAAAKPANGRGPHETDDNIEQIKRYVDFFASNYNCRLETWKQYLDKIHRSKEKVVLWGSGSKAVAFLTTLNVRSQIKYVVDINPYRWGTFIAGSGQEIVPPEFLQRYKPDTVIVVNPIYQQEIRKSLTSMGLKASLTTLHL
jgi:trans-aconitate methyltransferase